MNVKPQSPYTIAISSTKGGVGKSTITASLAVGFASRGWSVGIVDADIHGPNIPDILGYKHHNDPQQKRDALTPHKIHGLQLISVGLLVDSTQPIMWRGIMLHKLLTQFMTRVTWQPPVDILLIDLPPGTGDIHISLTKLVSLTGSLVVTTPHSLSLNTALRGIEMLKKQETPLFGVIENMSFIEPQLGEPQLGEPQLIAQQSSPQKIFPFGRGKTEEECKKAQIPFLGCIPIHASLSNFEPINAIKMIDSTLTNLIAQIEESKD